MNDKNRYNKNNNKYNKNNNENNKDRMNARERRINAGFISRAILAATVIMTVIGRNLPAVVEWIWALSRADDKQKLSLLGLFCSVIGEATIYGMPTATRNLLQGLSAPSAIVALTNNRKVVWLLNYIEDSYSSMNIKQAMSLFGQGGAIGAAIEKELSKKSYLPLGEKIGMTVEEVERM